MAKDYTKEYFQKLGELRERRRQESKAQEDHSNFTILALVGIAVGTGFTYGTEYLVPVAAACAITGAVIGAMIDWWMACKRR